MSNSVYGGSNTITIEAWINGRDFTSDMIIVAKIIIGILVFWLADVWHLVFIRQTGINSQTQGH